MIETHSFGYALQGGQTIGTRTDDQMSGACLLVLTKGPGQILSSAAKGFLCHGIGFAQIGEDSTQAHRHGQGGEVAAFGGTCGAA